MQYYPKYTKVVNWFTIEQSMKQQTKRRLWLREQYQVYFSLLSTKAAQYALMLSYIKSMSLINVYGGFCLIKNNKESYVFVNNKQSCPTFMSLLYQIYLYYSQLYQQSFNVWLPEV